MEVVQLSWRLKSILRSQLSKLPLKFWIVSLTSLPTCVSSDTLHSEMIVFEKSDLEALAYKNICVFEDAILICCPNLDKWCFDWILHSKHYLYSPDFASTFISCQQTTLIHTGKLHHQSSCSAVEGLLTLFSKTTYSTQTAIFPHTLFAACK